MGRRGAHSHLTKEWERCILLNSEEQRGSFPSSSWLFCSEHCRRRKWGGFFHAIAIVASIENGSSPQDHHHRTQYTIPYTVSMGDDVQKTLSSLFSGLANSALSMCTYTGPVRVHLLQKRNPGRTVDVTEHVFRFHSTCYCESLI